jgi:hypothetical protein
MTTTPITHRPLPTHMTKNNNNDDDELAAPPSQSINESESLGQLRGEPLRYLLPATALTQLILVPVQNLQLF